MPVWQVYFGLVIILTALFSLNRPKRVSAAGRKAPEVDPALRAAVILLIIVAGFRLIDAEYSDEWNYRRGYEAVLFSSFDPLSSDFFFGLLTYILTRISTNPQLLIFACAAITNALIGYAIYRNSRFWKLAILLHLLMGSYFASWNIIRQYLAVGILAAALSHLFSRDWKKYFLYVAVASGFHSSALVMIPAYFILTRKAWSRLQVLCTIAALLVLIYASSYLPAIFESSGYAQYAELMLSDESYGVRGLRVIAWSLPAAVAFFFQKSIRKLDPKRADVLMNAALISALIMISSLQFVYISRLDPYFSIITLLLISLFPHLFRGIERKVVTVVIFACYSAFSWFLLAGFAVPFQWRIALF
ncbi:MAG TPA: EpsG family protein [Oligoflexia bacterium]|nr:EpsG family protein [Oligoflexia bacterium]